MCIRDRQYTADICYLAGTGIQIRNEDVMASKEETGQRTKTTRAEIIKSKKGSKSIKERKMPKGKNNKAERAKKEKINSEKKKEEEGEDKQNADNEQESERNNTNKKEERDNGKKGNETAKEGRGEDIRTKKQMEQELGAIPKIPKRTHTASAPSPAESEPRKGSPTGLSDNIEDLTVVSDEEKERQERLKEKEWKREALWAGEIQGEPSGMTWKERIEKTKKEKERRVREQKELLRNEVEMEEDIIVTPVKDGDDTNTVIDDDEVASVSTTPSMTSTQRSKKRKRGSRGSRKGTATTEKEKIGEFEYMLSLIHI